MFSSTLVWFYQRLQINVSKWWCHCPLLTLQSIFHCILSPHPELLSCLLFMELQSPQWSALVKTSHSDSNDTILLKTNRGGYDPIKNLLSMEAGDSQLKVLFRKIEKSNAGHYNTWLNSKFIILSSFFPPGSAILLKLLCSPKDVLAILTKRGKRTCQEIVFNMVSRQLCFRNHSWGEVFR